MLVSMVFCYARWCADKTTSVMKTLEAKEREGKRKRGITAELHEKCWANRKLVVGQPFWEESWQLREPSQVGSVPKQPIRRSGAVAYQ